jgi:DNA polymerase-1
MEEARLMQAIGCDRKTATSIIRGYLGTYPDLKNYMYSCDMSVKQNGFVKTVFGRVRHLPEAKILFDKYGNHLLDWRYAKARNLLDERRRFKNYLNNSKNFPIQGLAAHIVNRAMIQIMRRFKAEGIDGWIAAQVHDEITCIVREDQAELAKAIVRDCMQNTTTISIPLIAEPMIANNWAEAK